MNAISDTRVAQQSDNLDSGYRTETGTQKSKHSQWILTLTRACTENCTFCAVDALFEPTLSGCAARARSEQLAGRELSSAEWCLIVERIIASDPLAEFDLSGGDCLALPWVYRDLIPFILSQVTDRRKLAVTSTARSLVSWFEYARATYPDRLPGAVHVTYDGHRSYSADNIKLHSLVRGLGMEMHIECPLSTENCNVTSARDIYTAVKDAGASQLLLMRYFPVGRGADKSAIELEPSGDQYRATISEFTRLAREQQDGPTIKVQCALKKFERKNDVPVPCKMGERTWCVMPNGELLICPWAYGKSGRPLDEKFVAGNLIQTGLVECRSRARGLYRTLRYRFPEGCRTIAFVRESKRPRKVLASSRVYDSI